LSDFVELFEHFNHTSSFRALTDLALDEVSGDEIVSAFQLKLLWSVSPRFWSIRNPKMRAPFVPDNGRNLLTWTRAVRLTKLSKGLPADCIIEDDWYEEWLQLPFGDPAFWSFIEYATLRLEAFCAGALNLPEELKRRDERGLPLARSTGNSLDGFFLGSASRTGQLVRMTTDSWALSCFARGEAEQGQQQS
jgi:hypothetical protein